jgi:hypothetical protein
VLSIERTEIQPPGLLQYLVVHGRARITEGGGPELLQELAHRYLGPDVRSLGRAASCGSKSSASAASAPGLPEKTALL